MRFKLLAVLVAVVAAACSTAPLMSASTAAGQYVAMDPCFLHDTRVDPGTRIPAWEDVYVDVRGQCGIPESATAVAVILVAYAATTDDGTGWIRFWASDLPLSTSGTSMDYHVTDSDYMVVRLCDPESCAAAGDIHYEADSPAHWIVKAVGYVIPAE